MLDGATGVDEETAAVGVDVAGVEAAAFVAVTTTSIVLPTSLAASV